MACLRPPRSILWTLVRFDLFSYSVTALCRQRSGHGAYVEKRRTDQTLSVWNRFGIDKSWKGSGAQTSLER